MNTKDILILCIAGILAIGLISGAILSCQYQDRKALQDCIEKTGEPLECRHSIKSSY